MKIRIIHLLILLAVAATTVTACHRNDSVPDELRTKREYSILQHYEYEYRSKDNTDLLVAETKALGTEFDVIGLPKAGANEGYVWFIANAQDGAILKMSEEDAFRIDESTLSRAEQSVRLSPELKAHLARSVK